MISYMYPCEVPSFTIDIKKCLPKFPCTFYNSVYSNSCTVDFGLSIKVFKFSVQCAVCRLVKKIEVKSLKR